VRQSQIAAAAGLIALASAGLTAVRVEGQHTPAGGLQSDAAPAFAAPLVDISFLGPLDLCMGVVRPAELARREQFGPLVALMEQYVQAGIAEMKFKGEISPVSLSSIEYVACSIVNFTLPVGVAAPPGEPSSEMLCELAVRFVDEVDALAWAVEHVPDAVDEQDGDLRYVRVRMDGGMIAIYLAQRDSHTVVATYDLERLRQLIAAGGDNERTEQWALVDGGLVTLAFHPKHISGRDASAGQALTEAAQMVLGWGVAEGQPDPLGTAFQTIGDGTGTVCLGLDLDPQSSDLVVRSALACPDYATAKNVRESFQLLQEFVKEYMRAMGAAVMPNGDAFAQMYVDAMLLVGRMFAEAEFDFRLREDDAVDVWFEARGALPASLQQGLAALNALDDDMVQPAAAVAPAEAPADAGQE
jgi:hypothetical protein